MGLVDLQCHTTASDGTLTPTELVALAAERGLRVIAITDHDTTAGLVEALAAGRRYGVEVIPGVEINTDVPQGEVHILGYFIDWTDENFQATLTRLRQGRVGRAKRMVEKLADLGIHLAWERVQAIAGDSAIGRPHVAQALLEAGYISSTSEAFERFIGRTGPAYVERVRMSPAEATRVIRAARGLPVLAHPIIAGAAEVISEPLDLEPLLDELTAAGLVGIEAYYPGYPPEVTRDLLGLAAKYGLVATGGSDYHGPNQGHGELGSVEVPVEVVEQLKNGYLTGGVHD